MFLSKLKSVLIRVICGRLPFKQDMNVFPQIPQIFTDVLEKTKICVNPRNLWEIFLYAYYANCRSYSFLYTKKALM